VTVVAQASIATHHAELFHHAVVARILRRLPDGTTPRAAQEPGLAWLDTYRGQPTEWWDDQIDTFEATTAEHLPLRRLDRDDALILVGAGLIEDDIRFGSLFATLQEPLAARRPCFGLLGWLLAADRNGAEQVMARCQRLVQWGLLCADNPSDPRSEWVARMPLAVWDLIGLGRVVASSLPPTLEYRRASSFPPLEQVVVPPNLKTDLPRISGLIADKTVTTLVVRGPEASGRLTLLGALARRLGRDVLTHRGTVDDEGWRLLGPLSALGDALAVTIVQPAPGAIVHIPQFGPLPKDSESATMLTPAPLGIVAGRSGGVAGPALESALSITLGGCCAEDRARMWRAGGLRATEADLAEIARGFVLTAGNINRAAPRAMATAASEGRDRATPGDVRCATRTLSRQALETLATYLPPLDQAVPPILAPAASEELRTLLAMCRHREQLPDDAAAVTGGTLNRGVRALFSGPSGTGKTLTARYAAAQLGLDIYRVDLAAVVSKYIGETERNLDRLLSRAEELDVVLLLDEGDALMTSRTEVANANDRYANLETNFLLQRLEIFEGIVIITSNAAKRIDAAFQRRIDVTIELAPPDAEARRQIWLAHLPTGHAVTNQLLEEMSRRCTLTGGRIRNAARHAFLLSMQDGRPVDNPDLVIAIQREYRRMGASSPLASSGAREVGTPHVQAR